MGAAGLEPASPNIELNDQLTAVRNNNSTYHWQTSIQNDTSTNDYATLHCQEFCSVIPQGRCWDGQAECSRHINQQAATAEPAEHLPAPSVWRWPTDPGKLLKNICFLSEPHCGTLAENHRPYTYILRHYLYCKTNRHNKKCRLIIKVQQTFNIVAS